MGKATYKNNGGGHVMADGTEVAPGAVFSADPEEVEKFPNKFTRVHAAVPDPDPDPATGPDGDRVVTDEFPLAGENGLVVTKTKAGWVVSDGEEDLHEGPMLKKQVNPFIEEYLEQ